MRDIHFDHGSVQVAPASIVQRVARIPLVVKCYKPKTLGPPRLLVVDELRQADGGWVGGVEGRGEVGARGQGVRGWGRPAAEGASLTNEQVRQAGRQVSGQAQEQKQKAGGESHGKGGLGRAHLDCCHAPVRLKPAPHRLIIRVCHP